MEYLKNSNTVVAINGDQNAFLYEIVTDSGVFISLKLIESHTLYLDEIIDMKFINQNKEAILCSNSESIKLFNFETGSCELYPGHTDIVISVDKFQDPEDPERGWVLSGSKDQNVRLWRYDSSADPFKKIKCVAVFKGHNKNICSVNFAPKKGQ